MSNADDRHLRDDQLNEFVRYCMISGALDVNLYQEYDVKRGLRESNGKGVLTGLTEISDVNGFQIVGGRKVPVDGELYFQGYKIEDLEMIDNHRIKGFSRMKYPLGIGSRNTQDQLFEIEKSIILEYATYENCIIVGRCANYILRHRPNVLKVHFYAPYEKRLEKSVRPGS